MDDKNSEVKRSPREILIAKELVGFEVSNTDASVVKIAMAKNGKPVPQPTWARG